MKGKNLIFISRIKRDGTGVEKLSPKEIGFLQNTEFELKCLSTIRNTFMAINFNSYIVKIK